MFIGKKDMSLIRFYEDKKRYADLINGVIFHGNQIVNENDIEELDSRVVGADEPGGQSEKQFGQVYRDLVRKMIFGMNFVIFIMENQDLVHYAMPIRVIYEEGLTYHRRLEEIQKTHHEKKDLKTGAEFLGGFSKEDRVPAVVSLVIYYGRKPWDGATDLYELLDMSGIPEEMKSLVNHYPIHILDVYRFEHTEWFRSDIREVFEFIQCTNDKGKLKEFVESRKEKLENMEEDACDVIRTITNTKALAFREEQYRTEKGGINMCKGFEDWGKELEKIGFQRGQEFGQRQGLQKASTALFRHGMSVEEVAAVCEISVAQVQTWYNEWKYLHVLTPVT